MLARTHLNEFIIIQINFHFVVFFPLSNGTTVAKFKWILYTSKTELDSWFHVCMFSMQYSTCFEAKVKSYLCIELMQWSWWTTDLIVDVMKFMICHSFVLYSFHILTHNWMNMIKNNHGNTYDKKRNTGWKREGEPRDYLPVHNSNLRNQHYKATWEFSTTKPVHFFPQNYLNISSKEWHNPWIAK